MIPEYKIGGDGPESIQWDIIVVPEPEQDDESNQQLLAPLDPKLYQEDRRHIPVVEILKAESSDESDQLASQSWESESEYRTDPDHEPKVETEQRDDQEASSDCEKRDEGGNEGEVLENDLESLFYRN